MHLFILYLSIVKVRFHHSNKENVPVLNIPAVFNTEALLGSIDSIRVHICGR